MAYRLCRLAVAPCRMPASRLTLAVRPMAEHRTPEVMAILNGVPEQHASRCVTIYRPGRNSMQSGSEKTKQYKLVFQHQGRWRNPLMGWASTSDPLGYTTLQFDTEEAAVEFCKHNGFDYVCVGDRPYERQHQSYADNFKYSGNAKVPDDDFW